MPTRALRSRSQRKTFVKVPGGRVSIQRRLKKPKIAKCGNCGSMLSGIPREVPSRMKNLPKTKKRPQRPYGGVLCTRCLRGTIISKIR